MYTQMLTSKYGAELISFKVDGEEKVHQGINVIDENGKVYYKRQWPILFPTVGKCKKNQTIINGKNYEMLQHGFLRDMEFEPITNLNNFHSYVYRSNKKLIDKFPYEFSVYVTYRLDQNYLTTIYKVVNEGDCDMPFGIGSQPAFKIDLDKLKNEKYYLEFEEDEDKIHFLYLVDGLVGTEYSKNLMDDKRRMTITKDFFKDDTVIMQGLTSKKVSLKEKGTEKKLLTVDFSEFPYLAIWSKKNAPFICIAPWKVLPDKVNFDGVFRKKTNIILLKPKEEYECKYTVEFFN